MTALTVIGCIILFFAFIGALKAKITVEYNDEVRLSVRVLCFKIKILPKKEKKSGPFSMSEKKAKKIKESLRKKALKKKLKKQKKKQEKQQKKELEKTQPKKKKSLGEILDMIAMVKDIVAVVLKRFFGHLRIDLARLKINVAMGDAASTAIAYGAICDALVHLLPLLESVKGFDTPKAQDIDVRADYLAESLTADVKISFSLRVWHVFHVAFAALWVLIKHLFKAKAKKEQSGHKPTAKAATKK
ncbi:MAG: hypothetical protein J6B72_00435 [Clostridia bacterium]|nr:hypothetical protein [Clostridia bacterium]